MKEHNKKIGEILLQAGIISEMQLSSALGEQNSWGGKLCSIILKKGFASEESIASALEHQLGQKCISIKQLKIPASVLQRVKPDIAKKYNVIPLGGDSRSVEIAISDPQDLSTLDELSFMLGARIRPFLAVESAIKQGLDRFYGDSEISFEDPSPHFPKQVPKRNKFISEETITVENKVNAVIKIFIEKGLLTEAELAQKMRP
jgi:type IV pilus assembly protein PilB